MAIKKHTVIKWMLNILWIGIGAGTAVLLVAAVRKKDAEHCKGITINIKGVNNIYFLDNKDIMDTVTVMEDGNPVGKPLGSFNLKVMKSKLEKNVWVKNAELFFDNNENLRINVTEREPVARIFTATGTTFYIDTALRMLPLSEKFSARLPVFTDFPSDRKILSKDDSSLLNDIKTVSYAIQSDSFCMALIDQVDINSERNFELVPKIGNNIIEFGDATDAQEKLNKLKLFYKNVMMKTGWNHYSVISLQYKNQVVAKRKGADDKTADSLRTIQIMQMIAANAEKAVNDSVQAIAADNEKNTTDSTIIQQSIQRDENTDAPNSTEKPKPQESIPVKPIHEKPTFNSLPAKVTVTPTRKSVSLKPVAPKPKPTPIPAKKPATQSNVEQRKQPPPPAKKVTKPNNDY